MFGPVGLREAPVRNVADEHVFEAVRLLAADRGALLRKHEVAQQQVLERLLHGVEVGRKPFDGARPEHPSDHGRALEDRLRCAR